jgi:hypothetical protein
MGKGLVTHKISVQWGNKAEERRDYRYANMGRRSNYMSSRKMLRRSEGESADWAPRLCWFLW